MNIINLNDDSLRKIFIYLGFRDLINLSLTSERFRQVVNSTVKYIKVNFVIKKDYNSLTKFDKIIFNLLTTDDELIRKNLVDQFDAFFYIENLRLNYNSELPIDLTAFPRLKKFELNLDKVISYNFVKNKTYESVKFLNVKEYNNKLKEVFPNLEKVICIYVNNDLKNSKITKLKVDVLNVNDFYQLIHLRDLYVTWSVMYLNYSGFLFDCLSNLPYLDNFHITFHVRKGFLKHICFKIFKMVKIIEEKQFRTKLHVYFVIKKDDISLGYDYLKDSEIHELKKNIENLLPKLATFQINGLNFKFKNLPSQYNLFKLIGTESVSNLDFKHLLEHELSFELQNLNSIKFEHQDIEDENENGAILKKLADYKLRIKKININNCEIKQSVLDKIPKYFSSLTSFALKESNGIYNIDFLEKLNNLRYLTLQISKENDIIKLPDIVSKCSFLNYLTIYLHHLDEIKDKLINIYRDRLAKFPYMIIIITANFKHSSTSAKFENETKKIHINDKFFINILPD